MNEEKRMNGGYEIIESCQIGRTELVIGHNSKAPNPYVCWYCKDGSDYFWGYYCNQLSEARDKLNERYQNECRMPYNQPEKKQRTLRKNIIVRPALIPAIRKGRLFFAMYVCRRF